MTNLTPVTPQRRESEAGFHLYSKYRECARQWWLRYGLGIAPDKPGKALIFGGVMHEAIEAYYVKHKRSLPDTIQTFKEILAGRQSEYEDSEVFAEDLDMGPRFLAEWHKTWGEYDKGTYDLVEVETPYRLKLGPNDEFDFTVRVDRVMREKASKRYVVFDTKTTRWSIDGTMKSVDFQDQMTAYLWALRKAHPDWVVTTAVPDIIYARGKVTTAARPGEIYRSNYALSQFEMGMYGTILEITSKMGNLDEVPDEILFPRNGAQCAKFGCEFADICRTQVTSSTMPLTFHRDPWKEG